MCYSLLRWPYRVTGCAQQTFTVQNKPAAVAPKETITHHSLRFWIGRRKLLRWQPKFCGAEKIQGNRNQKYLLIVINNCINFCFLHCSLHELPIDMGNSSALLINILLGSFQLFLYRSASLWGWNNPVQRCLPVGGRLHYPRRRRWWLHALTDRLLWCATDDDQRIITQSIIFSFSIS